MDNNVLCCTITPLCATDLRVAAVGNNVMIVSSSDDSTLWCPIAFIGDNTPIGQFILLNKATGKYLGSGGENQPATLVDSPGDAAFWNWVNDHSSTGPLQFAANTDMNLNVSGNGPYPAGTPILIWNGWNSDPNELFRLDFKF